MSRLGSSSNLFGNLYRDDIDRTTSVFNQNPTGRAGQAASFVAARPESPMAAVPYSQSAPDPRTALFQEQAAGAEPYSRSNPDPRAEVSRKFGAGVAGIWYGFGAEPYSRSNPDPKTLQGQIKAAEASRNAGGSGADPADLRSEEGSQSIKKR